MTQPCANRLRSITFGLDKAYDAKDFVKELRSRTRRLTRRRTRKPLFGH